MFKIISRLLILLNIIWVYAFTNDWPVHRGNFFYTGNNDGVYVGESDLYWTYLAESKVYTPIVSEGVIYFTTAAGYLTALNQEDGSILFRIRLTSQTFKEPLIYKDKLFVADALWLTCFDKRTGSIIWARKDLDNGIYTTPILHNEVVFYGSRKNLFAKSIVNGHDVWPSSVPLPIWGGFPVAYDKELLFQVRDVMGKSDTLLKINSVNGLITSRVTIPYSMKLSSPVIVNKKIYATVSSNLFCYDYQTMVKIFESKQEDFIVSHPMFSDGSIILSLRNGKIIVLDQETGKLISSNPSGYSSSVYSILIAESLYYLGTEQKNYQGRDYFVSRIYGKDLTTFAPLIEFEAPEEGIAGGLAAMDGKIYGAVGERLYCVGANGEEKWGGRRIVRFDEIKDKTNDVMNSSYTDVAPYKIRTNLNISNSEILKPSPLFHLKIMGESGLSGVASEITVMQTKKKGETLQERITSAYSSKDGNFHLPLNKQDSYEIVITARDHLPSSVIFEATNNSTNDARGIEIKLAKIERNKSVMLEAIYFQTGKAALTKESIPALKAIHKMMMENKNLEIEISGHTDSVGDEKKNMILSEKRAASVKEYLIKNGVFQERLRAIGYGETRPVASNDIESGRGKNRRTEIKVIAR